MYVRNKKSCPTSMSIFCDPACAHACTHARAHTAACILRTSLQSYVSHDEQEALPCTGSVQFRSSAQVSIEARGTRQATLESEIHVILGLKVTPIWTLTDEV